MNMRIIMMLMLVLISGMLVGQSQDEDLGVTNGQVEDDPTMVGSTVNMCFDFTAANGAVLNPNEVIKITVSFSKIDNNTISSPTMTSSGSSLISWSADSFDSGTWVGTISTDIGQLFSTTICFNNLLVTESATQAEADAANGAGVGFAVDLTPHHDDPSGTEPNDNEAAYTYTQEAQPVVMSGFVAESRGVDGNLRWVTLSEYNNSHFEVERSVDGRVFKKIGEIKGNGTTSDEQSYDYVDRGIGKEYSEVYYRLKQVDYDGAYERSEIRVVNFERSGGEVSIYPNPVLTNLNIVYLGSEDYKVLIYNMLGLEVGAYSNVKKIDITQLEVGNYYVRIVDYNGSLIADEKIVVVR